MTNQIHPTAIIENSVELGRDNIIGPYCILTGNIKIGNGNDFKSHIVMHGPGEIIIGNNNSFFPFVSFNIPQDKKYAGEPSSLIIGDNNVFREYATANPGSEAGSMITKIGNNGLFMMSTHIAHDCAIGDNVIFANSVALAGHVIVEDYVGIGGLSAVHQRTRIGAHAMIGGMSGVTDHVIPYGVVMGDRAHLAGLNIVGMKRRGFSKETMQTLKQVYDLIFTDAPDKNLNIRLEQAFVEFSANKEAKQMLDFIQDISSSAKSLCKPK